MKFLSTSVDCRFNYLIRFFVVFFLFVVIILTTSSNVFAQSTSTQVVQTGNVPPIFNDPSKFKKDNSLSVEDELDAVRQHLIKNGISQSIVDRVDAFKTEAVNSKEQMPSFGPVDSQPVKVSFFTGQIKKRNLAIFNKLFSKKMNQGRRLAVNEYLQLGNEVLLSQAVKDKANELENDPLKMLNYVRNEIEYTPYYGSKKGPDSTLIERSGNDMDQAALLIAMLRYSKYPARYRQIDAKMSIREVEDMLGTQTPESAAEILSLNGIPYTYFVDQKNQPQFFVVEHTYIEAYIPYGHSRGVNMKDGGAKQWVPMDPSVNAYYYEQPVDIMAGLAKDGFSSEIFLDQYLQNGSDKQQPYEAFRSRVNTFLSSTIPSYTFEDAVVRYYPKLTNLSFIPKTLPYIVVADLDTYKFIPSLLRHTIELKIVDNKTTLLVHVAFVSDLAGKELLITYDPATSEDKKALETFYSLYDVVPLSLIEFTPSIKVNGYSIASTSARSTLGRYQNYSMEFKVPTRDIGGSVKNSSADLQNQSIISGNTNAIAFDLGHPAPLELRPQEDTKSSSYLGNQIMYHTALNYLYKLGQKIDEVKKMMGSETVPVASRATIFHNISVSYVNGMPFYFDWKGLGVDSSLKVNYFNRFEKNSAGYAKVFLAVFGPQISYDESNAFDDFKVESISAVKALKMVSSNAFQGITFKKITQTNEDQINSVSVSEGTKTALRTALKSGDTVYLPSAPFTYGVWSGIVYITINFEKGYASFVMGNN